MKPNAGNVLFCMAEGRICRMAQAVQGKDQPSAMLLQQQLPVAFCEGIWYLSGDFA